MTSNTSTEILEVIRQILPEPPEEAIIFMLTETDCSTCVASLNSWEQSVLDQKTNMDMFGFYYSRHKKFIYQDTLNKLTTIKWKRITDADIVENIRVHSNITSFPIAIHLKNRKIKFIQSINSNTCIIE